MMSRLIARMLLSECTGRDIWPVTLCRQKGVPEAWIEELADAFESGFRRNMETIYRDDRVVNQFYGVRDYDLAIKLGEFLGVDTQRVTASCLAATSSVRAIQEAVDEL